MHAHFSDWPSRLIWRFGDLKGFSSTAEFVSRFSSTAEFRQNCKKISLNSWSIKLTFLIPDSFHCSSLLSFVDSKSRRQQETSKSESQCCKFSSIAAESNIYYLY